MVKVGAAYGVDENMAKSKINEIKQNYSQWTLPNWKSLVIWFLSITGFFIALRGLISLSGYFDWIFIKGRIRFYENNPLIKTITYDKAYEISEKGFWLITFFVLSVIILIIREKKR